MGFCAGNELSETDGRKEVQAMNAFQRSIVVVCAAAVVVAAWLGRFEVVTSAAGDQVPPTYLLDRWTGRVTYLQAAAMHDLRPFVKPREEGAGVK